MSFFAIALLSSAISLQQGDVIVRSELSSHGTSVFHPVVYTITVRSKSAEDPLIEMPPLPAGLAVAGTSSSTQIEISMPGGRTNVARQDYQIIASRPGAYTILPATVRVGGAVYRTEKQDLSVGVSAVQPSSADAPIRLRTTIVPKSPYVGQQILMKLVALVAVDARFHPLRPPSYDPPAPAGFWIQDLPDPISSDIEVINGATTEVQTFHRAYFPLSAGRFTIPAGRLVYDMRGGVFFAPETREVVGDSTIVDVRPLPEAGKPPAFTGAVGDFKVMRGVDRSTAGSGDAVTYTLVIEGTGNVKSLPPPVFPRLDNADVYPPSEDATLRVVNGVVGGTRTFQWVIIPRRAGTLDIPAVTYSWFNPKTERYDSAAADPLHITVTPAVSIATAGGDTILRPIRHRAPSGLASYARTRTFLVLQLAPLAVLALVLLLRRHSGGTRAQLRAKRNTFSMRLIVLDAHARNEPREFYGSAIAIVGDASALAPALSDRANALMERLRAARYAPEVPSLESRLAVAADVRRIVEAAFADSRVGGRPGTRTAPSVVVVLMASAILAFASHANAGIPGPGLPHAIQRYEQRDYHGAVEELSKVVVLEPSNVTAWFDLGNAYYRSDDPGRATWAWLQALQLEPRSADIAHNLTIVNARRASTAIQSWFPVSSAELAWLAAAFWWLCMAAAIRHAFRPRPVTRIGGPLLATACATTLIMLLARWVGPDVVVPVGHGASLYSAPTTRTDVRDPFEVGDAAHIIRRQGAWLLVRTTSLEEGWVPVSDVLSL